jgi:hypothetical protein
MINNQSAIRKASSNITTPTSNVRMTRIPQSGNNSRLDESLLTQLHQTNHSYNFDKPQNLAMAQKRNYNNQNLQKIFGDQKVNVLGKIKSLRQLDIVNMKSITGNNSKNL